MKKVFRMVNLICLIVVFGFLFSGCTKEEPYDPSGKCGSVISSTIKSYGVTALFEIKVAMDDGYTHTTVSTTSYGLGERLCF